METLTDSTWDVIISGTGLPQSLLALALSRSGKKILHIDCNDYYGGDEATLSLSEAEAWAERYTGQQNTKSFSHAVVTKTSSAEGDAGPGRLAHARAYSLALAPQLLYSRSSLLPTLVSSKTHGQLEFQAVGSWFTVETTSPSAAQLTRVPGGREDVFQDNTLDKKARRSLMKLLRFVANYEEKQETIEEYRSKTFSSVLQEQFGLTSAYHAPIFALALSSEPLENISFDLAVRRIARYLTSIGLFGPGFGALLPKWGGMAEVSQVACRACAVGGGVYVLKKSITSTELDHERLLNLTLSDGEKVRTQWLAGTSQDFPSATQSFEDGDCHVICKTISIVSSSLASLFPPTSEGGVTPAGAVAMVSSSYRNEPPVHIFIHSSDSGECPSGQCLLYASVAQGSHTGFARLKNAVNSLLQSVDEPVLPSVLWVLQYQQNYTSHSGPSQQPGPVLTLQSLSSDLALEDAVLEDVKTTWQQITGADPDTFMKFEVREGTIEDEES